MPEKRTYAQRAETIKKAVFKRRKNIRRMAIEHLGAKCQLCGYDKCVDALDIHHRNPKIKSFGIFEDGNARSWARVKSEIEKCVLICPTVIAKFTLALRSFRRQRWNDNKVNSGKPLKWQS